MVWVKSSTRPIRAGDGSVCANGHCADNAGNAASTPAACGDGAACGDLTCG
jgi:hypothetical protein